MRLKITRALSGRIDGIHLSRYVVGRVYDVGSSVGSFLLSADAAVPAAEGDEVGEFDEEPPLVEPRTHREHHA